MKAGPVQRGMDLEGKNDVSEEAHGKRDRNTAEVGVNLTKPLTGIGVREGDRPEKERCERVQASALNEQYQLSVFSTGWWASELTSSFST